MKNTKEICAQLNNLTGNKKKSNIILLSVMLPSIVLVIIGLVANMENIAGAFALPAIIPVLIFIFRSFSNIKIKDCVISLQKTPYIDNINELFEGNFNKVGKAFFSEHYVYLPGNFVFAYADIKEIKKFGGNYFVETSAGRRKVYMSKEILTELKSKCNIN